MASSWQPHGFKTTPPFRDQTFRAAVDAAREIVKQIGALLQEHPEIVPPDLLPRAQALSDFRITDLYKVCIVGNTGHGKSSLLNSLLKQEGLARVDADGDAVTSFVTEYQFNLREQRLNTTSSAIS
jgi:predicted GTPase